MSTVTFPVVAGGATYTDDSDATTGLAAGGHKTRFIPALKAVVDTAADVVVKSSAASASAAAAAASAAYINGVAGGGTAAALTSPAFTGTPTAPTAASATNTTQLATTAFVQTAVAALVDASPATLNTLNELAAALGDDPAFATTITTALGLKAPLASPALTGVPTAPTAALGTNTTQLATTAFIAAALTAFKASPAFSGTPTAPTAALGTNTTQLATTAFIAAALTAFKASPAFSGTPTAPTAAVGTNNTQVATTAFAMAAAANAATAVAVPAASETVAGKIELATAAEVVAGTDALRAVTPAGLRSGLNASGSAPMYACRAWVNFNGVGTVAIRASGNVSSITDNGVGNYTVNFTTPMPDSNYAIAGFAQYTNQYSATIVGGSTALDAQPGYAKLQVSNSTSGGLMDSAWINASFFR